MEEKKEKREVPNAFKGKNFGSGYHTPEEEHELRSKGGKKRIENIRMRRSLKEHLLALLSSGKVQDDVVLALIEAAKEGNVKAFETIRDTIGEKPSDKMELEGGVVFKFGNNDEDFSK